MGPSARVCEVGRGIHAEACVMGLGDVAAHLHLSFGFCLFHFWIAFHSGPFHNRSSSHTSYVRYFSVAARLVRNETEGLVNDSPE